MKLRYVKLLHRKISMTVKGSIQKQALIVGAGAIGRGFLGPRLVDEGIYVSVADVDPTLIKKLAKRNPRT